MTEMKDTGTGQTVTVTTQTGQMSPDFLYSRITEKVTAWMRTTRNSTMREIPHPQMTAHGMMLRSHTTLPDSSANGILRSNKKTAAAAAVFFTSFLVSLQIFIAVARGILVEFDLCEALSLCGAAIQLSKGSPVNVDFIPFYNLRISGRTVVSQYCGCLCII